ncbi:MAG: hypothetical protein ACI4PG_12005, partial [Candidatus Ventricola sp.]
GYSEYTPSGNPSTVYDYILRVDHILRWEGLTWDSLPQRIRDVVRLYEPGGPKEAAGRKSHSAYINALRAFERFTAG